jgi:pSer/pThr/pTyr-binding forkhead associated (FHA) protein
MEVSLEIIAGVLAGEKFRVESGRQVQIGRGANADIAVTADPLLSESHFTFLWDEAGCRIRDLQSARGTFLNGQKINQAHVRNGDKIVAGQTHFAVRVKRDLGIPAVKAAAQPPGLVIEGHEKRPADERPSPGSRAAEPRDLLSILRTQPQTLFAILDAAKDPKVLEILQNYEEPNQSLYEGAQGEALAQFGPYLVELSSNSALTETLVREGWGKNWGIFLTSTKGFKETRRHFRHFLLVQTEDGRELYFRFYDPRVLRIFLPTCTPQEINEMFGPVHCFLMEAEEPTSLIHFTQAGGKVSWNTLPLAVQHEAAL